MDTTITRENTTHQVRVAYSVDFLQLTLDGFNDIDLVWDVNITYVSASHKEVIQLRHSAPPVSVRHLG
ncbi:hypothetical protein scyTo_0010261 [Scyliorhinus torazame]|uniref:Uncharacterized protein n=1 Tax=Scyliorhinus torazame TaxID=75743 RepID=A0A401P359_SCYTO|nr:hypothetical protein [Scyliorhinus torazame]